MDIRIATTDADIDSIIAMGLEEIAAFYDCGPEKYQKITRSFSKQANFRGWIVSEDGKDIGYITAGKDIAGYFNQVNIVEVYVKKDYRMSEAFFLLIGNAVNWSIELKVKRVTWLSQDIPGRVWAKLIGLPVNYIRMYSCEVG